MRGIKSALFIRMGFCTSLALFSGCAGRAKKAKIILNPLSDPNVVLPDYVSKGFEASGGRAAWSVTKLIKAECVVTFSKSDGSRYITEHHYDISAWPGEITVRAMEPGGIVNYKLTQKGIEAFQDTIPGYVFTKKIDLRQYTRAALEITTAPMRLLDKKFVHTSGTQPIKIEGKWYRSIGTKTAGSYGSATGAIFYQDQKKWLVDMIWFKQRAGDLSIAAKGYEYREFGNGVLLPTKIDIYKIDTAGISIGFLARIELYNIRCM